jgi:hypothetical protein
MIIIEIVATVVHAQEVHNTNIVIQFLVLHVVGD